MIYPIFVCGCDRSGTTMLGSMLGGGGRSIVTPESQFLVPCSLGEMTSNVDKRILRIMADRLVRHWRLKIWGISDLRYKLYELASLSSSYGDLIEGLVRLYGSEIGIREADYWIDHTPAHIGRVATIIRLFPNSKFVHIVRDGRAVAASFKRLNWGPNTAWAAADWWSRAVGIGSAAEKAYGRKRIRRVCYEDLVRTPVKVLRELCDFIGIEFEESMICGRAFKIPDYTARQHSLVGRAPDPSRLNDWRRVLSEREIELFEYRSADMLEYFGYKPLIGAAAKGPGRLELRRLAVEELFGKYKNRISDGCRKLRVLIR